MAVRNAAERRQDTAEFERLQEEKNRELEALRRDRDSVRREAEDLKNQYEALAKTMEEERRKNAQVEGDLQAQVDKLTDEYEQRQEEINQELDELRQKYAALIDEEQARLDELSPEVEAILRNRQSADDRAGVDRARLDEFQREREERKKQAKLREQQERLAREQRKGAAKLVFDDEHYVDSGVSQNFSEAELDEQCNSLFQTAPIPFKAARGSTLEQAMSKVCTQQRITIPIIAIRDKLYLIGSNRMTCDLRADVAMVKVGGGYQRFEDYVTKNEGHHQRRLVTYMINNQASLEWVVTQLIEGKNIQTGVGIRTQNTNNLVSKRVSTTNTNGNGGTSPLARKGPRRSTTNGTTNGKK